MLLMGIFLMENRTYGIGVKNRTSLAKYEEDSLDGDSFVSQSRFDVYARTYRNAPKYTVFTNERLLVRLAHTFRLFSRMYFI